MPLTSSACSHSLGNFVLLFAVFSSYGGLHLSATNVALSQPRHREGQRLEPHDHCSSRPLTRRLRGARAPQLVAQPQSRGMCLDDGNAAASAGIHGRSADRNVVTSCSCPCDEDA